MTGQLRGELVILSVLLMTMTKNAKEEMETPKAFFLMPRFENGILSFTSASFYLAKVT